MDIKVRVRATGAIRTVTHKAYAAMGNKVYEKLGPADQESETLESSESPNLTPQVRRSVSHAVPVVHPKIEATSEQAPEPEQEAEAQTEKPEPKKRGPKPGSKKSISSNPTTDEK